MNLPVNIWFELPDPYNKLYGSLAEMKIRLQELATCTWGRQCTTRGGPRRIRRHSRGCSRSDERSSRTPRDSQSPLELEPAAHYRRSGNLLLVLQLTQLLQRHKRDKLTTIENTLAQQFLINWKMYAESKNY